MPTVFKGTGITLSSASPQDAWTATAGAQTMVTALTLTNTTGIPTVGQAFLFNSTNGAKLIGQWPLSAAGEVGCCVSIDKVALIAGDKLQVANTSAVAVDVTVSVAEAT